MKKVIYTAIFNNYDYLRVPKYINEDFDYVLFLDEKTKIEQKIKDSSFWNIKLIKGISNQREGEIKAKDIKVNPQKYLSEYDQSIYIDGSFIQIGDANEFLNASKKSYIMCTHPRRQCAYEEATICSRQRLGNMKRLEMQFNKYKLEGFPRNLGLYMGGIIGRKHNKKAIKINNAWWNQISNYSMRDQLSMPYVLWKTKEKIGTAPYDYGIDKIFKLNQHK